MIIGDRLRALREDKKLSQGDIEKRTGLLRCYISWIRREFRCFRSKWPTIRHLSPKYLQQSLDFHKCSFSPPGVLVDESDGVSHSPTFG